MHVRTWDYTVIRLMTYCWGDDNADLENENGTKQVEKRVKGPTSHQHDPAAQKQQHKKFD